MARINKTQYAVLGCLSIRPMSAYEIKQFIQKSIAYFWSEREGQLYPTLNKLHENNFVEFEEVPAQKAGTKKIYSITKLGKDNLTNWLNKKAEPLTYRNELLLKLFFGNFQDKEKNIQLLKTNKLELIDTLETLKFIQHHLTSSDIPEHRLPYLSICVDYGVIVTEAEIRWCEKAIERIN